MARRSIFFNFVVCILHANYCISAADEARDSRLAYPLTAFCSVQEGTLQEAHAGIAAMESDQKEIGRHHFDNVLKSVDATALNLVGAWYADREQYRDAIVYFNRTVNISPLGLTRVSAWNDLGIIYKRRKKFPRAVGCFANACRDLETLKENGDTQADERLFIIRYNLGLVYLDRGEEAAALDCFNRVAQSSFYIPRELLALACIFLKRKMITQARQLLFRLLENDSLSEEFKSQAEHNMGYSYAIEGKYDQARTYFSYAASRGLQSAVTNLKKLEIAVAAQRK